MFDIRRLSTSIDTTQSQRIVMSAMPRDMDHLQFHLLDLLAESNSPEGSGVLLGRARTRGVDVSQATLGRALRFLDEHGFTVKLSNKGRVLTPDGRQWLAGARHRSQAQRWTEETLLAVGHSTLTELSQSMVARRAIEGEIARLAAERATPLQLGELRRIVKAQANSLQAGGDGAEEAVAFHRALAESCGNRFLAAAANLVRTSSEVLESLMFHLGTTVGSSYQNHAEVLEAITVRDGDAAERAMVKHLDELINDIDRWLARLDEDAQLQATVSSGNGHSEANRPGLGGSRTGRPAGPDLGANGTERLNSVRRER